MPPKPEKSDFKKLDNLSESLSKPSLWIDKENLD